MPVKNAPAPRKTSASAFRTRLRSALLAYCHEHYHAEPAALKIPNLDLALQWIERDPELNAEMPTREAFKTQYDLAFKKELAQVEKYVAEQTRLDEIRARQERAAGPDATLRPYGNSIPEGPLAPAALQGLLRLHDQVKAGNPDVLLIFEAQPLAYLFDADAATAAPLLHIPLGSNVNGYTIEKYLQQPGLGLLFTFEAVRRDNVVSRLTEAGHRVAVCTPLGEVAGIVEPRNSEFDALLALAGRLAECRQGDDLRALLADATAAGYALCLVSNGLPVELLAAHASTQHPGEQWMSFRSSAGLASSCQGRFLSQHYAFKRG